MRKDARTMKKWIAFLLLVAMMLSLSACIGEDRENQATEGLLTEEMPEETKQTTEETTASTEETSKATEETTETTEETTEATEESTQAETVSEAETEALQPETFWAEEDLEYPMAFYFSSGAGGWGTELYLNEDGSFTGYYHDSELGSIGENYPNGTVYVCNFTGRFGAAERLDMYTYGLKLEELTWEKPTGEQWIEDGVLYIASAPYGLTDSEDFVIYLPNTPTYLLSEDQLFWWPGRFGEELTTLNGYGLYNLYDQSGFFSMMDN